MNTVELLNEDKILFLTRVLIRYTSIFHNALNTTWFNNNNKWLWWGIKALIRHDYDVVPRPLLDMTMMWYQGPY